MWSMRMCRRKHSEKYEQELEDNMLKYMCNVFFNHSHFYRSEML